MEQSAAQCGPQPSTRAATQSDEPNMAIILIAEANPTNLKLATVLLKNAGHSVLQATDGLAAVDMARSQRPDLVLMDVQMAGMDGLTATRILKQDANTRLFLIMALTAFAMFGVVLF